VTRKDVAARANVSTAVVSYVVNNGPRPVAHDTRERVQRAIVELGYFPNEVARSLRSRRTAHVGLIVPDLADPTYAEVAAVLERELSASGRLLLVCQSDGDPERERRLIDTLRNKRVDGVVLFPSVDSPAALRPLVFAGVPVVVMDRRLPNTHSITVDSLAAARAATGHLLALGHRCIGLVGASADGEIVLGYGQTLADAGLAFDDRLVRATAPGPDAARRAVGDLLDSPRAPTAIIATHDAGVLGATSAAAARQLAIPRDLSVVGIGITATARFFAPATTGARNPRGGMAALAFRILQRAVEDSDRSSASETIVSAEWIDGASTAPPRR
jgi:LacI family transcriptional regulator